MMNIQESIDGVVKVNSESEIPQTIYVIEECSELIKALTKKERGKGDHEEIIDESCDVLTTIAVFLRGMNVDAKEIEDRMNFKCSRAIERWLNKKEG